MLFANGDEHNQLNEWSQVLQVYDKDVIYSSDDLNVTVSVVTGARFSAGKRADS